QVMKRRFGITFGKGSMSFFGSNPPEMREIEIDYGKTMQIPWGTMVVPVMEDAEFNLGSARHPDFGIVFAIQAEAKRKFKGQVEEFFEEVHQKLKTNSIYKGKAFVGCAEPAFLDLSQFDPHKVVYSQKVKAQIES